MPQPANPHITRVLHSFFVAAVLILYSVDLLTLLRRILEQYPSNPNLSGFVPMILYVITPPMFLMAIWLSRRHTTMTMQQLFESLVLTVGAVAAFVAASEALMQLPFAVVAPDNVLASQLIDWAIPLLISGLLLSVVIRQLRRVKQW